MVRKKKVSSSRTAAWLAASALVIVVGVVIWQHRSQLRSALPAKAEPPSVPTQTPTPTQPSSPMHAGDDSAQQGVALQISGKLQIRQPPRDAQIGVSASDAVILLRKVEIYQWHEQCEGSVCRYDTAWSDRYIDSGKFRTRAGHENTKAPFADAHFAAADVRLDDLTIDPELVTAQHPAKDYPVAANALPPNLAASFSVVDGVLYAGGDAAQPRPGTLRISYRIVPGGEISVSGIKRGSKLETR